MSEAKIPNGASRSFTHVGGIHNMVMYKVRSCALRTLTTGSQPMAGHGARVTEN